MTTYSIAPEITSISFTDGDITIAPDVIFIPNGSADFPNNKAVITIYNESNEMIAQTNEFDISSNSLSIPQNVWNQALIQCKCNLTGEAILKISVEGYRYDESADESVEKSGPYYSKFYPITIEHIYQYERTNSTVHTRICSICGEAVLFDHNYTCAGTIGDIHTEVCTECGIGHGGLTNFEFTSIDANSHSVSCPDCDWLLENEEHNFRLRNYDSTHHEKYCVDCGYSYLVQHSYTDEYEYWNTDKHKAYCACGAFILGAHFYQVKEEGELLLDVCMFCKVEKNHVHDYVYTSCKDGKTHHTSCRCGISKYEQCFGIAIQGELRRCNKCNQVLSGGLIVPWGDDGEDALPAGKEDEEYSE